MEYPKISIITINLNQAGYLEEAMQSVLQQDYPNLEYIIIDGGSNDGSVEVIKKCEHQLAYWESEPDEGHVYALQKGLGKATGDIMGWINSDDKLHYRSLFAVAEIFREFEQVQWLTGFPSWFNTEGLPLVEMKPVSPVSTFGFNTPNLYLKWALWSKHRFLNGDYMAIQQESTFWRKSLWEKAGGKLNTDFKLAFDFELWCRFFRHAPLYFTNTLLAGFRHSSQTQKSKEQQADYLRECEKAIKQEQSRLARARRLASRCRFLLSRPLKVGYYTGMPWCSKWYGKIMGLPEIITFNFETKRYELQRL